MAQGNAVTRNPARVENLDAAIGANTAAAPQAAGAATTTVQSNLSGRVSGVVVADSTGEPARLKVVGHPRLIGATVTLYEVAPGDTVTFTELSNVQLESVVTTGLSRTEPQARRSVEKSAATAIAPAQVAAPSPPVPSLQVSAVNGLTTISWLEVPTGNMLKLSGRMSVERLKEIKLRIERERAAEAAKKKP
jgi:plastocyanin